MTINCRGNLIDLTSPKIMGILNLTPDSFYDGGRYKNEEDILRQTEKMLTEGATFIDVGAYSSRPGAKHISEDEEMKRLLPVIEILLKEFPEIILSIDTFRGEVAKKSVKIGAAIINDISGGNLDERMMETVAELQVPYILMHMKGNPQTMQQNTEYQNLLQEITYYFSEKLNKVRELGINDVILDPGFGFSKNNKQNFSLLREMKFLKQLDCPLLAGVSRKSMIYKTLETTAENALNGTSVLNTVALLNGASILRVHDVKPAKECITLFQQLNN
ncbi:dihydropteroate synthase [Mesonia maritima]|uniref:Dihydropteroate synthase n=1 Tax=Mesonia maritima TaxID=1793873 RepID=A0ABU1K513_9FLAO|nr:dihydropteroate synthase [Mesonia maritima]MDR6300693.1 dihydropteroate synthase [Mesonia maritima]